LAREFFSGPNYLVYDDHRDAPPRFASKGAKKGAVYLVDKLLAGKKMELFLVLRCRWTCEGDGPKRVSIEITQFTKGRSAKK
jgi:hypothetical protein